MRQDDDRFPKAHQAPSRRLQKASEAGSGGAKLSKAASHRPQRVNWYDYPEYFDLAFRDDTPAEADFIAAACRKYCPFPVRSLLEPACGTGRLVAELARRGFRTTGIDLNVRALAFARQRLRRQGLPARWLRRDIADFGLPRSVDAAYCTLNSFRHLLDENSARRHLECVGGALRPGGVYILGFHLVPPDAELCAIERWSAVSGSTRVFVTFRAYDGNRRRRLEQIRVTLLVRERGCTFRLQDDFSLRLYTARQFRSLLRSVPAFELCGVYDFWYDIDQPLQLTDEMSDTVFILRRRA